MTKRNRNIRENTDPKHRQELKLKKLCKEATNLIKECKSANDLKKRFTKENGINYLGNYTETELKSFLDYIKEYKQNKELLSYTIKHANQFTNILFKCIDFSDDSRELESSKVVYFTPEQQERSKIMILPHKKLGKVLFQGTRQFITLLNKNHKHPGYYIAVIIDGNMYAAPSLHKKIQHSTFNAGGKVNAAFLINVSPDGKVKIALKSGHYRSTPEDLHEILEYFKTHQMLDKIIAVKAISSFLKREAVEQTINKFYNDDSPKIIMRTGIWLPFLNGSGWNNTNGHFKEYQYYINKMKYQSLDSLLVPLRELLQKHEITPQKIICSAKFGKYLFLKKKKIIFEFNISFHKTLRNLLIILNKTQLSNSHKIYIQRSFGIEDNWDINHLTDKNIITIQNNLKSKYQANYTDIDMLLAHLKVLCKDLSLKDEQFSDFIAQQKQTQENQKKHFNKLKKFLTSRQVDFRDNDNNLSLKIKDEQAIFLLSGFAENYLCSTTHNNQKLSPRNKIPEAILKQDTGFCGLIKTGKKTSYIQQIENHSSDKSKI